MCVFYGRRTEGEGVGVWGCVRARVYVLDWGWSRGPTVSVEEERTQEPEGLQSLVARDTGLDSLAADPSSGQKHLIF